jgi:[protein-PII] uridylyltransferase
MPGYYQRARDALRQLLGSRPPIAVPPPTPTAAREPIDDTFALSGDRITFVNPDRAATDSRAWLHLLECALDRNQPIAADALELIRAQARQATAEEMLWGARECHRFLALLRPRPGLSARLAELADSGVFAALFPECLRGGTGSHSVDAIARLGRLIAETDLIGTRFGTMARELHSPELVVLALLLHQPASSKAHDPAAATRLAEPSLSRLQLETDARHAVEFLIENQLQMPQVAFRQDTSDPDVIGRFASAVTTSAQLNSLSTEEHLKMLTVMTVADLGAAGRELTSWRAELLWRLFVDTYNHLTLAYGDELIGRDEAARTALHRNRPEDIGESELVQFLDGLPQRYLTLFDPADIYQHVRLSRDLGPDEVRTALTRRAESSTVTIVTLDKPYLFSNISGALSSLGADILRGQALTSQHGFALDVFEFVDGEKPIAREALTQLLSEVVAGTVDIAARLAASAQRIRTGAGASPLLYFDNDSSHRYTILQIVASDVPGLMFRVSRALSDFGCEVDLVLIATEADSAVDVFHIRKDGAKLTDSDQLALTDRLERAIADVAPGPEPPPA